MDLPIKPLEPVTDAIDTAIELERKAFDLYVSTYVALHNEWPEPFEVWLAAKACKRPLVLDAAGRPIHAEEA